MNGKTSLVGWNLFLEDVVEDARIGLPQLATATALIIHPVLQAELFVQLLPCSLGALVRRREMVRVRRRAKCLIFHSCDSSARLGYDRRYRRVVGVTRWGRGRQGRNGRGDPRRA